MVDQPKDQGLTHGNPPPHPQAANPNVFISYSRIEEQFTKKLILALESDGMHVWLDLKDIRPSEDWVKRILSEIERIGTMLVVITPESCASGVCNLEVNHAADMGKRLIPILRRDVPRDTLNDHLKNLHWILFRDGDDEEKSLRDLRFALRTDLEWIDQQAALNVRTLEWDRGGRGWTATLRGAALRSAEQWLDRADEVTRTPTARQRDFVRASRRATNRFRLGTAVVAVLLTVFAVAAPLFWNRSRLREREAIDAEFQLDANSSPSPLDLARRPRLRQLVDRARSSGHSAAIAAIQDRLRQIPPAQARVEVLPANASRAGLETATTGQRLFLWSADRIEVFDSNNEGPAAVYRQQGGRILWADGDPCADGVLFEVDFESFADPVEAASVEIRNGGRYKRHESEHGFDGLKEFDSAVYGNERAFFFGTVADTTLSVEMLCLTTRIEKIGLAGDRDGNIVDYVFQARRDDKLPGREQLSAWRYGQSESSTKLLRNEAVRLQAGILTVSSDAMKAVPLGYADGGRVVLFDVEYNGVQRTGYMHPSLGPMKYTFVVPMIHDAQRIIHLAEPTVVNESANVYQQSSAFAALGLTDRRPDFWPAALDMAHRQVVLRDRLIRFPEGGQTTRATIELDWVGVAGVRFTPDGQNLIFRFQDRGVGFYDLRANRLARRFPGPLPVVRDLAVTPDAQFVYVLEENGSLTRWDFAAFGADGWAAVGTPSRQRE